MVGFGFGLMDEAYLSLSWMSKESLSFEVVGLPCMTDSLILVWLDLDLGGPGD